MKAHFEMMAAYNEWANRRLYAAAAELPEGDRDADLGAFFGSVTGTLNHLVVADLIWLARFEGVVPPRLTLDQRLYDDLGALEAARTDLDRRIARHVAALTDHDLVRPFSYTNVAGEPFSQPRSGALAHFFNHQTHHRGQVHALLTRLTGRAPALDLIYFQRAA